MAEENKNIIKKTIKKSSLKAKNKYDYKNISLSNRYFVDVEIDIREENIEFAFNIEGLSNISNLKNEDVLSKLRFLISVSELEEFTDDYIFSLEPENLYYGDNDQVKILEKDINEGINNWDLLNQYKALVGYVWGSEYTYKDYLEGGIELLSKDKNNKFLNNIRKGKSIKEIREVLTKKFQEVKIDRQNNKRIIDRKKYKYWNILSTVSLVFVIVSLIYIGYMHIKIIPIDKIRAKASEVYIKKDYVDVVDTFRDTDIKNMNQNDKYILSDSYIKTESFTDNQKENLLKQISLDSKEDILNYWVYISKNDSEESIDTAKKLSDDELLIYAYMRQLEELENDTTMDGTEKSEKIKEVEDNIDSLLKKLEDSKEDS